MALLVDTCRVDGMKIHVEQELEADFARVVFHHDGLGGLGRTAAHFFVCRVFLDAVGISDFGLDHAVDHLEIMFGAPEAAAC